MKTHFFRIFNFFLRYRMAQEIRTMAETARTHPKIKNRRPVQQRSLAGPSLALEIS